VRERDGGGWWPADKPLNYATSPCVPVRPQGSIPVIVRLVAWPTGDELVASRAIRWAEVHVMVMLRPIGAPSGTDELTVWLQARDVYTSIPRRPYPRRKVRGPGAGGVADGAVGS
jgi:hypothetical protein